jgi:hypothetical protein
MGRLAAAGCNGSSAKPRGTLVSRKMSPSTVSDTRMPHMPWIAAPRRTSFSKPSATRAMPPPAGTRPFGQVLEAVSGNIGLAVAQTRELPCQINLASHRAVPIAEYDATQAGETGAYIVEEIKHAFKPVPACAV